MLFVKLLTLGIKLFLGHLLFTTIIFRILFGIKANNRLCKASSDLVDGPSQLSVYMEVTVNFGNFLVAVEDLLEFLRMVFRHYLFDRCTNAFLKFLFNQILSFGLNHLKYILFDLVLIYWSHENIFILCFGLRRFIRIVSFYISQDLEIGHLTNWALLSSIFFLV